jgi:hypothetical protein
MQYALGTSIRSVAGSIPMRSRTDLQQKISCNINSASLAGIEESRQPVAFIAAFRVALLTITPNPTHF